MQVVIIDEVVVEVVEAIVDVVLLRSLRAVLAGILRLLFLLFSGLLHVATILLHRRQGVVVLDARNHCLDERVEAVLAGAATTDRVRVVLL